MTLPERDASAVWHPYAAMPPAMAAMAVESASGTRLRLANGRELIDGMSSWWATIHGYNHPVLNEALTHQASRMAHVMFGGLTHEPAVELCELLVAITPPGLTKVFLSDSGSVAVEVAIKMAIQHWIGHGRPERHRLLTVRSGYHGDTFAAMSVCDPVTGMHHMFSRVLPEQLFAPEPNPAFGETFSENHIAGFADLLETNHGEVAAVILEPVVQGAGGMRFYSPEYLRRVRALCDEFDVLLIADEIATGFGRSGELFGCNHAGVTPDIMCLGKALTGGYMSMAATLCTDAVSEGVCAAESGALMHGPTFMGNPLSAAVATASTRLLLAGDWQSTIKDVESQLVVGLESARSHENVADVRVLGAIGVVETLEELPMSEMQQVCTEHGVWLRPFGRLIYTMPPYISSNEDITRICAAILDTVDRVSPMD
jgi:adenosylmethionine-8-amino-7-oxononanoate aminotransferase